jgi:hypothetical protein
VHALVDAAAGAGGAGAGDVYALVAAYLSCAFELP